MNNEFLPAYKVYQQVIDLELYYAFVDLVVHTSQEEKAWEIYRNIVFSRWATTIRDFPATSLLIACWISASFSGSA